MTLSLLLLFLLFGMTAARKSEIDVWPHPLHVDRDTANTPTNCSLWAQINSSTLQLDTSTGINTPTMRTQIAAAWARLQRRVVADKSPLTPFRNNVHARTGGVVWPMALCTNVVQFSIGQVSVRVNSTSDVALTVDVDASYELAVNGTAGTVQIAANTVWGAMYAFETLVQMIDWSLLPDGVATNVLRGLDSSGQLRVRDAPRFAWRGLLVDSARHFLSLDTLKAIVDGMAMLKMNVLHWHLTDAEAFPFESRAQPSLSRKGAYDPVKAVYTPSDVFTLLDYAEARGVIVMPEIDVPSHAASWGLGRPDIVANCWPWLQSRTPGVPLQWPAWDNVALDVSNANTIAVVRNVYDDLNTMFRSKHFHLGGDEVNGKCWASVPTIRAWMVTNNFSAPDTYNASTPLPRGIVRNPLDKNDSLVYDTGAVQLEFESQLESYVRVNLARTAVLWEEAFYHEFADPNSTTLPPLSKSAIVHVWTDPKSFAKAAALNRTILSSLDWYLDRVDPLCDGPGCNVGYAWVQTWRELYSVDPEALAIANGVSPADAARLILGGEAASWGESVDAANALVRAFTRGVAIAERLWSSAQFNDSSDAVLRLSSWRCKALRAGIEAGAVFPDYCDVSVPPQPTPTTTTTTSAASGTTSGANSGTSSSAGATTSAQETTTSATGSGSSAMVCDGANSASIRTGMIVVGSIGGVLAILLLATLVMYCRRNKPFRPPFERFE